MLGTNSKLVQFNWKFKLETFSLRAHFKTFFEKLLN